MVKGFGTGQKIVKKRRKDYIEFLRKILWAVRESKTDIKVVYRLLKDNLNKLDDNFLSVLRDWATTSLPRLKQDKAYQRALAIGNFSKIIQEFPELEPFRRAIYIEIAIVGYEFALLVFTQESFPLRRAEIQYDLGNAYCDRLHGDFVQNIKQAITAFQDALSVYTYENFPEDWASIQNNLATAYSDWRGGNREENLELAILCCNNALQIYTRQDYPEDWAMVLNNLGSAYRNRIRGNPSENLQLAISYYKNALEVYKHESHPEDWAMVQHNLGNAYRELCEGNREKNLEQALCYLKTALKVYKRETLPQDWAMVQNNLALTYYELREIDQAIICFRLSLEIYTPSTLPVDSLGYAHNFGEKCFAVGCWTEAIEGYHFAIEAVEQIRASSLSESPRQEITVEFIGIYHNIVKACINAGQIEKAFEYSERSRSKRLVDLMAGYNLSQGEEIPPKVQELLQQYEELQQQIDQERQSHKSENSRSETRAAWEAYNEAIASLETQKQQVWENLRREDPVLAGEIQVNPLSLSEIQNLLIDQPNTAILSFYTTNSDTHIFVVQQNQITLHTCTGEGLDTLQGWIEQNWLLPYRDEPKKWKTQINSILRELAERLQISKLISEHLQGIEELILVPHLLLHQIPFAALPTGEYQEYLGDKFLIRYTPSCQILEFCQPHDNVETFNEISLQYGTVEDAEDNLPCARFEGEQLAKMYNIPPKNRLIGSSQATSNNYRQLAQQVQVLHSCHHAQSRLDNPLASQLTLAGSSITLGQLMTPSWRLPQLVEVFLSCCETNLGIPSLTDDILTLATGFLCAGARSVVSSLWLIDDLATALFSIFYYQHRQQGNSRPEALQQAQIKLRELKKEALLSREDIQEFHSQVIKRSKEAETNRNKYSKGSATYLEWDCEYKNYRKVLSQIYNIKNSTEEFPFSHPRYWAAFICHGLR
ncbi:MAG: CHAT domain-containing tetratricopeptide repeat protein [Nostoc sp.]|uniref:CHAT domain-containing protein n=1 Tax=Nostoc sp. TaxID=1180 RepID=UPI002FFCD788